MATPSLNTERHLEAGGRETAPAGPEQDGSLDLEDGLALLALSHTQIEHQLYRAMFAATLAEGRQTGAFGVRSLLRLTGLRSYGSVKRGCAGLLDKLSVERTGEAAPGGASVYRVYSPAEIFGRRTAAGLEPYPAGAEAYGAHTMFRKAVEHLVSRPDLSRREALVILCCAEGLTNAEIGQRLQIGEQTVKFHLRQIFDKFRVRRRAELISRVLTQAPAPARSLAAETW